MSRNGYENAIESSAVKKLLLQTRTFYPSLNESTPHDFYQLLRQGGNSELRGHIITRGDNPGKLTLEHSAWKVDKRITPADIGNIEGIVMIDAAEFLLKQAKEIYNNGFHNYNPESFYNSLIKDQIPETRQHITKEGKLTLIRKWVIDERIIPVDCYNLMEDGEDIAKAVNRLLAHGYIG